MPIFEYRCVHCGNMIEKIQRKPVAEVSCPVCNKLAQRSVSLTSVAVSSSGGSCSAPAASGFT